MDKLDCAVIGAGVVGLACARALAMAGRDVVILERAMDIGTETSARNSEIIHAGIYYAPGSMKARLCRKGKEMLYDYCASHGVAHARTGKLIVAADESQHAELEVIERRAREAGVADLRGTGRGTGRRPGTQRPLHGRAVFALHRSGGQPRSHARLPGRCRGGRSDAGAGCPGAERAG